MLKKAVINTLFISALCATNGILSVGQTVPVLKYGTENHFSTKTLTLTTLSLKRTETIDNAVWGSLYVNGKFICYTLENNIKKIPAGTYKIRRVQRGFRLEGVQGRSNINIEIGNYPFESLGCVFVGTKKTSRGIEGSKLALFRLIHTVEPPALLVIS